MGGVFDSFKNTIPSVDVKYNTRYVSKKSFIV